MSNSDDNLLEETLDIIEKLRRLREKYGGNKFEASRNLVEGFFALVAADDPTRIDPEDLKNYFGELENNPQNKPKGPEKEKPGPYESDPPKEFGMYRKIMESESSGTMSGLSDTSIYSPRALPKVESDFVTHNNTPLVGNTDVPSDQPVAHEEPLKRELVPKDSARVVWV